MPEQTIRHGQVIKFLDDIGRFQLGKIRIKPVRCGKPGCTKCPHYSYAYVRYYAFGKHREKYIGKAP